MSKDISPIGRFATVLKNVFPNLDPNFFKAPWSQSKSSDNSPLEKPYQQNVWVYACCNAISMNLSRLPRAFDMVTTEEPEYDVTHPILKVFRRPNPLMTGSSFWENVFLDLLLPTKTTKGGQCFLVMESGKAGVKVDLSRGDIPHEIYPFNDELMKPVLDDQNILKGWNLCVPNRPELFYGLNEIIRINLVDPENPLRGQCPMYAAQGSLRMDSKASGLNERFMDNNASLGGVLETEAEIEGEQGRAMLADFESKYGGEAKAGKLALLHSGIKYQQFRQSHVDMQYLDQRRYSRDEILAAYRVPKAEISLYEDMNFATALSADRSFWMKTLLPLDEKVLEAINSSWVQYVDGGKFQMVTDLSRVEALQDTFANKLAQAQQLIAMMVPMEEVNRRLGLNLNLGDYPWMKTALVSFALAPAEDIVNQEVVVPTPEGGGDPAASPPPNAGATPKPAEPAKAIKKKARPGFQSEYQRRVIRPDEIQFNRSLTKYMVGQRNRLLDKVDQWAASQK